MATTTTSKRKKSTNGKSSASKSGSTRKSASSKSAGSRTKSSTSSSSKRASPSRKRNGAGGSGTSRSRSSTKPASKRSSSSRTKSGGSRSSSTRSPSRSKSRQGSSRSKGSQAASGGSGGIVEKAKKPAAAVGVALLGAAGVVAAQKNGKGVSKLLPGRRSSALSHLPKLGSGLPKPDLKKGMKNIKMPKLDADTIDWVEEKAKGLGDASYRVAEMTDQARKVRKAVGGD